MSTVIINADDFGLSDGICRAIVELFEHGAISSTSLMLAAPGALARSRRFGAAKLSGRAGVHLQLTGGTPLSPRHEVPSLIDANGRFRDVRQGPPPDPEEVGREWRRQIAAAEAVLGASPSHLDTHHGMHRMRVCFDVYADLACELDVPVRGGGGEVAVWLRERAVRGTVAVVRDWTGRNLAADALGVMINEAAAANPDDVVEVVAHPGYVDGNLRQISSLVDAREKDRSELLELSQSRWLVRHGHELARSFQV